MITGTLHLSKRMVAVIGDDMPELLKAVENAIQKHADRESSVSESSIELSGADARLELFDVNDLSGLTIDSTAAFIKIAISSFVRNKGLIINPFAISVLSHAAVES